MSAVHGRTLIKKIIVSKTEIAIADEVFVVAIAAEQKYMHLFQRQKAGTKGEDIKDKF